MPELHGVRWQATVPGGWPQPLLSHTLAWVVADGVGYLGGVTGLLAVDLATGAIRQLFAAEGRVYRPMIAGEVAYYVDREFALRAVDLASGQERWRFVPPDPLAIRSAAALHKGTLYVISAESEWAGYVHALDPATGVDRWADLHDEEISPNYVVIDVDSEFAISDDLLFCAPCSGNHSLPVYAIALPSGQLRWQASFANGIEGTPVVDEGRLIVVQQDWAVYAYDALTGQLLWEFPTLAMRDAAALASERDEDAEDADGPRVDGSPQDAAGATRWHEGGAATAPAVDGGRIYYGWQNVNNNALALHGVDAASGQLLWQWPKQSAGMRDLSAPVVAGGVVYVGSRDAHLYALDATTGALCWQFTADGPVGEPVIYGDLVCFATANGTLYALY